MRNGLKIILLTIGGVFSIISCQNSTKEKYVYEKSNNYKEIVDNSISPEQIEQPPIKALSTKQYDFVEIDEDEKDYDDFKTEENSFQPNYRNAITVVGISEKIYFYDKPNYQSKTRKYFVKGQKGQCFDGQNNNANGEFIYVNFEYNGNITSGYILKSDVSIE